MRKNFRERLADAKREKAGPVQMDLEMLLKLMLDDQERPMEAKVINPTQAAVIFSRDMVKLYKGPAGCAKTSTVTAAVLIRMLMEPGSKGLIGRHDYNDLLDTTMLRAQEMINRLPPGTLIDRDKSPPAKWYIASIPYKRRDGKWIDTPSQITFMGLKEGLGSYDFNVAALDEADEIEKFAFDQVLTRMRTKAAFYVDLPNKPNEDDPDGKDTGGYYSVYLSFNPPDKSHWLYTAATGRDHQERVVQQPSGTLFEPNPKENVRNLPSDYYQRLTAALPEDQKKRFVDGEWGGTFPGKPVFRQFSRTHHVKEGLQFHHEGTLYRFWDFGYRHPCCIWAQLNFAGNLFILKEEMGTDIEITAFARKVKSMTARLFPDAERVFDVGDVAVKQQKDTGSALALLHKEKILMHFQQQSIDRGLTLLRKEFERMIEGAPAIQIDKRGCPILISALSGGYHFKNDANVPFKDGYYDHLPDALRYGVVGVLEPLNLQSGTVPDSVSYNPSQDNFR